MTERDANGEKLTLVEWLGFRKDSNFENNRGLGIAFGVGLFLVALLLGLLAIASVFLLIAVVFKLFLSIPDTDLGNALRGIAFALGAIVGLPFLVWRSWVAHRQAHTAEQGLITDRINKAVEQLGKDKTVKTRNEDEKTVPNIEVRLGALYALERIAQDSERDHIPIMETICAYIRENTQEPRCHDEKAQKLVIKYLPLRADIQAALTILGRRSAERRAHECSAEFGGKPYTLDLRNCNLQRADISGAKLAYTLLDGANLAGAQIKETNLAGARLDHADLMEARLDMANLTGARLYWANLSRAILYSADLKVTRFDEAILDSAQLQRADLTGASLLEANLTDTRLIGANLTGACLEGANLTGAWFRETNLTNSDLHAATLEYVSAQSTDFKNCKNLTQSQLDGMFGDRSTKYPKNLERPSHWPKRKLNIFTFTTQYKSFLKNTS